MTETYEVEADVDAPVEVVWQALTDGRQLERWFCEHADVDIAAGRFDFWGRHTPGVPTRAEGHGRVIEVDPHRLLRVEWGDMTISFHLDGSTVRVVHEGAPERPTTGEHLPSHWWQFALGHLQALLTTGGTGPRFDWSAPHSARQIDETRRRGRAATRGGRRMDKVRVITPSCNCAGSSCGQG